LVKFDCPWSFDERSALFPKEHLGQVLEKQPVRNQAVCTDRRRRAEAGLEDARHRGKESLHGPKLRQVRNEAPAESGEIDDEQFLQGGHKAWRVGRLEKHGKPKAPACARGPTRHLASRTKSSYVPR
jgi:hypothetical protein